MTVLINPFRRLMGLFPKGSAGSPADSAGSPAPVSVPSTIRERIPQADKEDCEIDAYVQCISHPIHGQLLRKGVSVDQIQVLEGITLDRRTNIDELANLLKKMKDISPDIQKKVLQLHLLSKNLDSEQKDVFKEGFWKKLMLELENHFIIPFDEKVWNSRLDKLIDIISRDDPNLSLYLHIPLCEIENGINYVDNLIISYRINPMRFFDWTCKLASSNPALKHILISLKQNKPTLASQILQWNEATLRPVQNELYQAVQMQLESTENFPTHYQRLFHFASEHFDNQEKDSIIKFALDALNLKDETIISILEENELHLLEKVFQSSKEGSGNLDCFMKSTDPILAKLAFQLKSLLKPADLQAILESELSPEEKKAILEKCMAISMHLGKQAQKLLQSAFEKEDIANLEEAFDDILRTGLANFFQSAYDEEAICRGAGNHRGDLVFYNHLMASIFPLLIGQGQVINITMARFIEASLFGLEDSSKDDVPHWLVEEQLRSLLQRVQDSAELRSILNGIECNLDPQSPGLEAVRLQFGLPPDREVNVTQAQLATLMAIGLNMRQGNTPTCNADASIMRLEPEEMAGAVSSFLRHGVMKCVQVDEEEGLYPFNHSHMIPAGNNVPLHHENLSYRVNVNGDLECGNDTVPLWEMPAVRAACNALGITNAEESIKDVLKRMEFSDTSFQELQIMEFLQELSSQVEKIDSTYLSAFERAYSAFHAIEENLAIRLVQGATLVQNTFSNGLMLESFYNMIFDHFDQTTRLNETKFIEVFNGQVKFIFRSQEHLGYRFGGFVPYLVHTNENGNYRLERLQKGSKGWIVVKEKLEEAIPEKDRSKWTQNALLKLEEFSNGDQEEICGGPKSLSGVGWVFQNLDLDQFRLKGSKPFGRLLDKLRNLEGQRLKENPFKRYKMNSRSLTSDHDLNWLPGHPTIQGLIDSFRPGEDENMQSVIERELINPGNEMREKELSEDELDRLFAILDDLKQEYFPNWSSEQISAFKEQIDNVKNMNIYSFLRILELSSFKDVIENEKKFYIRFDWLISNAFNPEGKSIVLADTNWHDETGSPVIISVRHNIRTNLPEIWVTDEFGKIIVAATDFFRDQYFSV